MEADSDDTDSSGGSFVESEDSGSDDEDSLTPEELYESLLESVVNNTVEGNCLDFFRKGFCALLQDVDRFCHALLASESRISIISIGEGRPDLPRIDVTDTNKQAWQTLCAAFRRLDGLKSLKMYGDALSLKAMVTVINAMPEVDELEFDLHLSDIRSADTDCHDIIAFIEALSDHPCQNICLHLKRKEAPTGNNIVTDSDILSRFLSLHGLDSLTLRNFDLSLNECNTIANAISSNTCYACSLFISSCTFQDEDGGRILADAFQTNMHVKTLMVDMMLKQADPFTQALIASLAQNKSIEEFTNMSMPADSSPVLVDLITTIARQNTTMRFIFVYFSPVLGEEEHLEIRQALQKNYTLEQVNIDNNSISLDITRLNQAGRRYMLEDAASRSKCIAVLAKVKNHVDSLYFHLRENPVLFTGCNVDNSQLDDCKKRKADDLEEDEGNRIKANRTSRT